MGPPSPTGRPGNHTSAGLVISVIQNAQDARRPRKKPVAIWELFVIQVVIWGRLAKGVGGQYPRIGGE